jgi:hypothetical protein
MNIRILFFINLLINSTLACHSLTLWTIDIETDIVVDDRQLIEVADIFYVTGYTPLNRERSKYNNRILLIEYLKFKETKYALKITESLKTRNLAIETKGDMLVLPNDFAEIGRRNFTHKKKNHFIYLIFGDNMDSALMLYGCKLSKENDQIIGKYQKALWYETYANATDQKRIAPFFESDYNITRLNVEGLDYEEDICQQFVDYLNGCDMETWTPLIGIGIGCLLVLLFGSLVVLFQAIWGV